MVSVSGLFTHALCALLLASTCLRGVRGDGGNWAQTAKLVAADGTAGDKFGGSVSVSGSTVVVGAEDKDGAASRSGSVYVFEKSDDGTCAQTAKLVADDAAMNDYFGGSVSVSGSTVVVGAREAGASHSGSVYVFEKNDAGTWAQTTVLADADGAVGDSFGFTVSVSGPIIVVGAGWDDDAGTNSGSAYVFEKSDDGTWAQTAKLVADDAAAGDSFGFTVSVSGSTVVVGAWLDDDAGSSDSGSAYVFEKSDDGTWAQTAKLVAADAAAGDRFGVSVTVSGSTIVVGAYMDHSGSNSGNSGSAYVFEKSDDGQWAQAAKLVADDAAAGDQFGISVSVSGSTVVVGARQDDDDAASNSGSAYVFEKSDDGTWAQAAKLVADDGAAEDWFGESVSVSGSTVVVGAWQDDDDGSDSGSGYIWMLPVLRPCTCCERSMKSFGFSVGAEDCDPEL